VTGSLTCRWRREMMAAVTDETPTLEQRVAALEEMIANPLRVVFPPVPEFTPEQEAELREALAAAMKAGPHQHRVNLQPPPLAEDEVRQLLRECMAVVKPGEHLILRVPWSTTPSQVRELQEVVSEMAEYLELPFRMLVLPGDELGVVQAEASDGT